MGALGETIVIIVTVKKVTRPGRTTKRRQPGSACPPTIAVTPIAVM